MITIKFTQCREEFMQCKRSLLAAKMPIILRCEYYVQQLRADAGRKIAEWATLDEHLILIAMWLAGSENGPEVQLIQDCKHCLTKRVLNVDNSGCINEGLKHGFFEQRLAYLSPWQMKEALA